MKYVWIAAGLLACPAALVAQQPSASNKPTVTAALSLADAIAIARDNNPTYRQAVNTAGPAAWGVRNAYSSLLIPTLTAAGEWLARLTPDGVVVTAEHAKGDVAARGTASDLLLFLYGRVPAHDLEVFGDSSLLGRWRELVSW